MRWLPAVLLLGCSSVTVREVSSEPDASVPLEDAGEPDADAPDASAPGCPRNAPEANCVPVANTCSKGSRYSCQGPACPTGAVGSCSLASVRHITSYSEVDEWCCEKPACVHAMFGDDRCQNHLDGTPIDGGAGRAMWVCPFLNGERLATPPGSCVLNGLPAPDVSAVSGEYCCR